MIALLLPNLHGGGAERAMVDLARELADLGHSVEILLMRAEGGFLAEVRRDFAVVDLAAPRIRDVPFALSRYLRAGDCKAVIANMWPLTSAAVVGRALSRQCCRLLLVEHNTLSRQYASWGRVHTLMISISLALTCRFADQIAAVSAGAAADTARLAWLPKERIEVLHNPIPQRSHPSPEALAKAEVLWGSSSTLRILTVGSLKDQKNHSLLLRAFSCVRRPNSRLMLLGQGKNEGALRALAAQLGLADRVILPGFQPDPTPFYASADLFVLSSDYEGFGNVIVEALAQGLPVVSTDCPSGPREILAGGRWGTLVPVGDADALAAAIERAVDTDHDHVALRLRAADFLPQNAARRYLDLLFPARNYTDV